MRGQSIFEQSFSVLIIYVHTLGALHNVLDINFFYFFLFSGVHAFKIELRMPRYVERGHSATLKCDYELSLDQIHKVEFLKNGKKMFQFVRGRNPPFKNYTVKGATLDVSIYYITKWSLFIFGFF